ARVTLRAGELGGAEGVPGLLRLLLRVHPGADAVAVGVVVLPGEFRRLHAPRQAAANAGDLVRSDLFAVARSSDDDAERARVRSGGFRGGEAEGGVVILGVRGVGPVIGHLVPGVLKVSDDGALELDAR